MTFPILRHMNMVLTVTLGKKELEENIFMFVWCLRKLCKKSDLFTLDINSGGFINQFYQTLDTQFWYTIFLHLSSMNFIEKKKIWIILLVWYETSCFRESFQKANTFPGKRVGAMQWYFLI